jgi:hypothetical protein
MQPSAAERIPRVIRISFAVGVAEDGRKRIASRRSQELARCFCLAQNAASASGLDAHDH